MPGLDPGIHDFKRRSGETKVVGTRMRGHD